MSAVKITRGPKADIFWEAVAFPFKNLLSLIQIALIPWLITEALYWTLLKLFPGLSWPLFPQLFSDLIGGPISIIYYAFFAMFAVAIHRMIILGERPGWLIYRFGRNELAYAVTVIAANALLFSVPGFVIVQTIDYFGIRFTSWMWTGMVVCVIILSYLMIRLLLIYPHAAVTGRMSFSATWGAMKGNVADTFIVLVIAHILAACILTPPFFIIAPLFADYIKEGHWTVPLWTAGWMVFGIIVFVIEVAFVSFLYRDIMGTRSDANNTIGVVP